MHVVVFFINLGGYHAARLRAAHEACVARGWRMTALQGVTATAQHPWGLLGGEPGFTVETLAGVAEGEADEVWMRRIADALPGALDRLRPDVVVIPGWGYAPSRAALGWCRRTGTPAVLMSESKRDDERRVWAKERLKRLLYVRKFDAALVGGSLHRDYLIELGMKHERVFFGYDAVDNDFFERRAEEARSDPAAARARQPLIPRKPYFVCLTRLIERKNINGLMDAYRGYRESVGAEESWDLVVCGSGPREAAIHERVKSLGLEGCVHLPGFVTYEQVGDWYGLAGAFVHPALQEQWGLVVNEACAAGLPVLCSAAVGACPELVRDGVNGFVFDPHDVGAMTAALVKTHRLGPERRAEMGREGRRIVSDFSPERFADGLMRAVEAASVSGRRSHPATAARKKYLPAVGE